MRVVPVTLGTREKNGDTERRFRYVGTLVPTGVACDVENGNLVALVRAKQSGDDVGFESKSGRRFCATAFSSQIPRLPG
ncbi:hypothetical protein SODALDRAFT_328697 [Sodiomyces alkalinus F11]|uniref:Uncharacterized protein n=1 Tax=Sodiomyces alkalinus (strain CBS 110278 / VKM F-3762 / F11) TaxID=1314773 RepID=A0A3N2PLT8_SODAK|nr:hypothetical protein SODALDRAFT_328697 [Sodiomyces alkalinus F11]ROT35364.1 hypothetical protein SODALDRAFT_328697 [Sodiomyces alkalinus F11]